MSVLAYPGKITSGLIQLVYEKQHTGYHQLKWDAGEVSSVLYFFRLKAGA